MIYEQQGGNLATHQVTEGLGMKWEGLFYLW